MNLTTERERAEHAWVEALRPARHRCRSLTVDTSCWSSRC